MISPRGLIGLFKSNLLKNHSKASLCQLYFTAMSDTELASDPVISEIPRATDLESSSDQPNSNDTALSNAETYRLFSQLLDAKFDQKFLSFQA